MRTSASWTALSRRASRSTSWAEGGSGGRGGRRSTQAPPSRRIANVTFECPSPIVSASSGPSPRPARVQERLQRTAHQQRLELLLGGLLGRVDDGRHRRAPYPHTATRAAVGGFWGTSYANRTPDLHAPDPARRARAGRAAPGDDLRGARRAARRPAAATPRSTRSAASASPRSASSSTGSSSRPAPTARRKPSFNASDPNAYPALGQLDGLMAAAAGARHQGHPHAHRPRPALGDEDQEGSPEPAQRQAVRPVRHGAGPPLRRAGRDVVDLERAQPAAVPDAAVPQEAAGLSPGSTATSTAPRTARSAACPRTGATRS